MSNISKWLNTQIEWLKGFLQDIDGKPSHKRASSYIMIGVFIFSYLKIAIPSQQLLDIPMNWATLLGALILGTAWMASKENKKDG